MSIGRNIYNRRMEFGLDQSELAERVGITQSMVSYIEKERKTPSVALLKEIAETLGCTVNDLLTD